MQENTCENYVKILRINLLDAFSVNPNYYFYTMLIVKPKLFDSKSK